MATLGMELTVDTDIATFNPGALVGEVALQLNIATDRVVLREASAGVAKVDILPPPGSSALGTDIAKLMADVFINQQVKFSATCGGPAGRWQEGVCTYTARVLYMPADQANKLVSPPPPPVATPSPSDDGLSTGAIVGIAIVCAVVPAAAVAVGCYLATRKARAEVAMASQPLTSGASASDAAPVAPEPAPTVIQSAPVAPEPPAADASAV